MGVFVVIRAACEAFLFVFDRPSAYLGLGAAAYGAVLWLITRFCIRLDLESEGRALKAQATGWRLWLRAAVVAATIALVIPGRQWYWHSTFYAAIQHFAAPVHLGHDSALPNSYFTHSCRVCCCLRWERSRSNWD